MRLELVTYTNMQALHRALLDKEVHATCSRVEHSDQNGAVPGDEERSYHTTTRVQRIYDIIHNELSLPGTTLTYVSTPESGEKH